MLCLALGIDHPDFLNERLSDQQVEDWFWYYRHRPFGHWIESMMTARLTSLWAKEASVESLLPKIEIKEELDEEEQMILAPGFSGAEEFLRSLQRGDRQEP